MVALMLAGWMAYAGDCHCQKLAEKLAECCRAMQHPSAPQQMDWVEYYRHLGPNPYPYLQWAVPNSCLNGPPASPPATMQKDCIEYYKRAGINPINYAPVFVSPTMQWAVPNSCLNGPPASPPSSAYDGMQGYPPPGK
jgi:hypothetical protein